ncbi:sulfite exporter TauE/SafE family protein [Azotobacter chroococcum subsp. isscasi]|uniref:sulfite exporter TauE/SafE family protein n=1 Tax=Azotobacter chroococcum TaxID=353 RepID=UPI00103C6E43|nr:sulfite exporter TauE/SafE family protein [Azotobacter chroococcum]TBW09797.1 sulfite exporter TauE/SafE family protein [Azotobacter chroococcum subsp. isscasi]
MSPLQFLLDIGLGLVLGCLGGLFGIGGGLIAIPVLGLLFGLDQHLAQGSALVMVVPNVLLALRRYHQHNRIDLRHALVMAGTGFCAAWLGAQVANLLDAENMRLAFGGFLLALALWTALRLFLRSAPGGGLRRPWPWLVPLGAGSGVLGGLFGVGGAVLATPLLTTLFGASQVVAQGLSLALAAPSAAVSLATYALHGRVDWLLGIPLAIGGLLSIGWGVRMAHALPERALGLLFCGFLVFCALLLLLD